MLQFLLLTFAALVATVGPAAAIEANQGGALALAVGLEPSSTIAEGRSADSYAGLLPWNSLMSAVANSIWHWMNPSHSSVARSMVASDTMPLVPAVVLSTNSSWEVRFEWGLYWSKHLEAVEGSLGSWVSDVAGSRAGVPRAMLDAEELMAAADLAPQSQQKGKTAERALRVYNHAKWLAERNMARAAEWRYREAHRLARISRRSVLAAHSLSRLGYFLMHWHRHDDAREVLLESERLSKKSNPLAPYLLGIIERRSAGADIKRLLAAEERILHSGEQPAEELEVQRQQLSQEIHYWRLAQHSPRHCTETFNVAHVAICLCSHSFSRLRQLLSAAEG